MPPQAHAGGRILSSNEFNTVLIFPFPLLPEDGNITSLRNIMFGSVRQVQLECHNNPIQWVFINVQVEENTCLL